MSNSEIALDKATKLRDQVLKSWNPPLFFGNETPAQIAQTSVMQTLAFVFGKEFMPKPLTQAQKKAIDSGIEVINSCLMVRE